MPAKFADNFDYMHFDFNKINFLEISTRRMVLKLNFIINFFLYTTALAGILCLSYYIYHTISGFDNFSLPLDLLTKHFWNINNIYLKLFLFSFLLDLYLIYRLSRTEERQRYVLKKDYQTHAKNQEQREEIINITEAFSESARQIIEQAYQFAADHHFREVAPLHLLASLITNQKSNIILFRLGINVGILAGKIKRGMERTLAEQTENQNRHQSLVFSLSARQAVLQAYNEVYERGGGGKVDVLDLWIPLAEIDGYTRDILYDLDIESYKLRHVVLWSEVENKLREVQTHRQSLSIFKSKHGMNRAMTAVETRFLNGFSQDLTFLAKKGYLSPSLGHEKEMEQLFTILQAGAHGAVLVGSPGIGKQSMVEELAQDMAAEQVPEILQDKRLLSLSVAGILAGGDPQGASQRLYQALSEAAHSGNVVLFIKDIHNLVGIGLRGEGGAQTMGIDQVAAQALNSNRFLLIGTTDYKNYTRYLENSSLGQALIKIDVPEPEPESAVLMLEARVPFIEGKHRVYFTYQALEKAVKLTNQLIHNEHQPAKALKILQETAGWVAKERGQKSQITETDVARVISNKVNMPLAKIEQEESRLLMNLEEQIHQKYINQDYAVAQIASALRRSRAELRDLRRPIASFLFVGPTGVGKTELAKRIAEIYFNSEKDIIRIDMSEFQEVSSISRLIGTTEGHGLLTEAVIANPYSILLLDELEKAHKNILNIFLQVMDDGRLTSGQGEVVDFTNLIIVATSNAGTQILQEKLQQGNQITEIKEKFVKQDLLAYFNPEFLNRFDDIILFQPLSSEHIEQIAELILADIAVKLEEKGIALKTTPEAVRELAGIGFDPLYGARPLRRAIQDHVQNALANFLISGRIGRRDVVWLESGGQIRVEKAQEL